MSKSTSNSEGIQCPFCDYVQTDDIYDLITYWGEDNEFDFECSECEKKFKATEVVTRTWVSETDEEVEAKEN